MGSTPPAAAHLSTTMTTTRTRTTITMTTVQMGMIPIPNDADHPPSSNSSSSNNNINKREEMTAATGGITSSSSCDSSSSQFPYKHCNEIMTHIYICIIHICLPSQLHEKLEVEYLMVLPNMMLAIGTACEIEKTGLLLRPRKFEIWTTHIRSKNWI